MAESLIPGSEDWGDNQVKTSGWAYSMADAVYFHSEQEVSPIIERNKADRKAFAVNKNSGSGRYGEMTMVARIPNIVVDQLMREGLWWDKKAMKKWLNDPNNKGWRTADAWL